VKPAWTIFIACVDSEDEPNTTSWRASADRRHAAAAATTTTTTTTDDDDDDDDDIATSSQYTLAAADAGRHELNLATMRTVTHSAGYLPGGQSQQQDSRPTEGKRCPWCAS